MALKKLFEKPGLTIFSYRTIEGNLRYGNRICSDSDNAVRVHEGSDFMTEEEAKQDAENFLTDNQILDDESEEV